MLLKYALNLSDYVISGFINMKQVFTEVFKNYSSDVMNTFSVMIIGQILSIFMAFSI